ncbi:hypothetical protein QBC46DRAFT_435294 [Diplogelasinospora grovesii]|uniref:Heterokaryon incompatibility domain-containing protein n=1 Tax=Diplogelasinospora grovesii TaxID=303347 RepID=A0AAN6S551_9PEZI|nr:hypothetical protein QBC46DRAFT_435294 [Diplogelasinospora grovesii]
MSLAYRAVAFLNPGADPTTLTRSPPSTRGVEASATRNGPACQSSNDVDDGQSIRADFEEFLMRRAFRQSISSSHGRLSKLILTIAPLLGFKRPVAIKRLPGEQMQMQGVDEVHEYLASEGSEVSSIQSLALRSSEEQQRQAWPLVRPVPTYRYLPLSATSSRLVRFVDGGGDSFQTGALRIELVEFRMGEAGAPKYEALSYRWHDSSSAHAITCRDRALVVTDSCKKALEHLRSRDGRLWVDSICIDQNDSKEKSHQVQLMADIGVCLAEISQAAPYAWELSRATGDGQAIQDWFSRIWILQEVALAQDVLVYCGNQTVPWKACEILLRALQKQSQFPVTWRYAGNLVTFRKWFRKRRDLGGVDIAHALVQARSCHSSDPRDKVYALFGVCRDLAMFIGEPDYDSPVDAVWSRASIAGLCNPPLWINSLNFASFIQQQYGGAPYRIPSWAADLSRDSRPWISAPLPSALPPQQAGSEGVVQNCDGGACLHIRGVVVDVVDSISTRGDRVPKLLDLWKEWWHIYETASSESYKSSSSRLPLNFWMTLGGDTLSEERKGQLGIDLENKIRKWHRFFTTKLFTKTMDKQTAESEYAKITADDFIQKIIASTKNRAFGRAGKGAMGLFEAQVKVNDVVAVFQGAQTPFVLRKMPSRASASVSPTTWRGLTGCKRRPAKIDDCYQLVGPCYLFPNHSPDSHKNVGEWKSIAVY